MLDIDLRRAPTSLSRSAERALLNDAVTQFLASGGSIRIEPSRYHPDGEPDLSPVRSDLSDRQKERAKKGAIASGIEASQRARAGYEEAVRLYDEDPRAETIARIALARGCHIETVRRALRRAGRVVPTTKAAPVTPPRPYTDAQIAALYLDGWSRDQIAAGIHIGRRTVVNALRRQRVPMRPPRSRAPRAGQTLTASDIP